MDAFDDEYSLAEGYNQRSNRARLPAFKPPSTDNRRRSAGGNQQRSRPQFEDDDDEIEVLNESISTPPRGRATQRGPRKTPKPNPRTVTTNSRQVQESARQSLETSFTLRQNNPFSTPSSRYSEGSKVDEKILTRSQSRTRPTASYQLKDDLPRAARFQSGPGPQTRQLNGRTIPQLHSEPRPARRNSLDSSMRTAYQSREIPKQRTKTNEYSFQRGNNSSKLFDEDDYGINRRPQAKRKTMVVVDNSNKFGAVNGVPIIGFQANVDRDSGSSDEEIIQSGRLNQSRQIRAAPQPKKRPVEVPQPRQNRAAPGHFVQNGVTYVAASIDGTIEDDAVTYSNRAKGTKTMGYNSIASNLVNQKVRGGVSRELGRNDTRMVQQTPRPTGNQSEQLAWSEFELSVFARLATHLSQSVEGTLKCHDCGMMVVPSSEASEIMTESVRGEFKKLKECVYDHIFPDHLGNKAKRYKCRERMFAQAFSDARGHMKRWHPNRINGEKGFSKMFYPDGCIIENFPALGAVMKIWLNKCFPEFPNEVRPQPRKPPTPVRGRSRPRNGEKLNDSLEVLEATSISKPIHSRSKKTTRRTNDTSPVRARQIREMSESPERRVTSNMDNDHDILSALYGDGEQSRGKKQTRSLKKTTNGKEKQKAVVPEKPAPAPMETATIKMEPAEVEIDLTVNTRRPKPSKPEIIDLEAEESISTDSKKEEQENNWASQEEKLPVVEEIYRKYKDESTVLTRNNLNESEELYELMDLMLSAVVKNYEFEEEKMRQEKEETEEFNGIIDSLKGFIESSIATDRSENEGQTEAPMGDMMQTLVRILFPPRAEPEPIQPTEAARESIQAPSTEPSQVPETSQQTHNTSPKATDEPENRKEDLQHQTKSSEKPQKGTESGNAAKSAEMDDKDIIASLVDYLLEATEGSLDTPKETMSISSVFMEREPVLETSIFMRSGDRSTNSDASKVPGKKAEESLLGDIFGSPSDTSPFLVPKDQATPNQPSNQGPSENPFSIFEASTADSSIFDTNPFVTRPKTAESVFQSSIFGAPTDQSEKKTPEEVLTQEVERLLSSLIDIITGSPASQSDDATKTLAKVPEVEEPVKDETSECEISLAQSGDQELGTPAADLLDFDDGGEEPISNPFSETSSVPASCGSAQQKTSEEAPLSSTSEKKDPPATEDGTKSPEGPFKEVLPQGDPKVIVHMLTGTDLESMSGRLRINPESLAKYGPKTPKEPSRGQLDGGHSENPATETKKDETVSEDIQPKQSAEQTTKPVEVDNSKKNSENLEKEKSAIPDDSDEIQIIEEPSKKEESSTKSEGKPKDTPSGESVETKVAEKEDVFSVPVPQATKRHVFQVPVVPEAPETKKIAGKDADLMRKLKKVFSIKLKKVLPKLQTPPPPPPTLPSKPQELEVQAKNPNEKSEVPNPEVPKETTSEEKQPEPQPVTGSQTVSGAPAETQETKSTEVEENSPKDEPSKQVAEPEAIAKEPIAEPTPESMLADEENLPILRPLSVTMNESSAFETTGFGDQTIIGANVPESASEVDVVTGDSSMVPPADETILASNMNTINGDFNHHSSDKNQPTEPIDQSEAGKQSIEAPENKCESVDTLAPVEESCETEDMRIKGRPAKQRESSCDDEKDSPQTTKIEAKPTTKGTEEKSEMESSKKPVTKSFQKAKTLVAKARQQFYSLAASKKQETTEEPPSKKMKLDPKSTTSAPVAPKSGNQKSNPISKAIWQSKKMGVNQKQPTNTKGAARPVEVLKPSPSVPKPLTPTVAVSAPQLVSTSTKPPTQQPSASSGASTTTPKTPATMPTTSQMMPQKSLSTASTPLSIAVSGPRPSTGRNLLATPAGISTAPSEPQKAAPAPKAATGRGKAAGKPKPPPKSRGRATKNQAAPINLPIPKPLPPLPSSVATPSPTCSKSPESTPGSSEEASPALAVKPIGEATGLNASTLNATQSTSPPGTSRSFVGNPSQAREIAMKKLAEKGFARKTSPPQPKGVQQKPAKGQPMMKQTAQPGRVAQNVPTTQSNPVLPKPATVATKPEVPATKPKQPLGAVQQKMAPASVPAQKPPAVQAKPPAGQRGQAPKGSQNQPPATKNPAPPKGAQQPNPNPVGHPKNLNVSAVPIFQAKPQPSTTLDRTLPAKPQLKRKLPSSPVKEAPEQTSLPQTTAPKPPATIKPKFVLPKKVCPNYVPPGSEEESPKPEPPKPVENYKSLLKQTVVDLIERRKANLPTKCIFEKCQNQTINKLHETNLESHVLTHFPIKVRYCPRCDLHFHLLVAHLITRHPEEKESQWKEVRSVIEDNRKHHEAGLINAIKSCFPIPGLDKIPKTTVAQAPAAKAQKLDTVPQPPVPVPAKPQPTQEPPKPKPAASKEPVRFKDAVFNKARRQEQIRQKGGAVHCRHKNCEMRKKNTCLSHIQMELHIMAHFQKALYFCAKCNRELKLPLEHLKVNHQDIIKQNLKPSELTWIKDLRLKHEDALIELLEECFPEDPETKRLREKFAKIAKEGETNLPKEEVEKKRKNKRKTKEEKEASIAAVRELTKRRKMDCSFSVEGPEAEKTLRKLTEERLPIYTKKLNEVATGFRDAGKRKGSVQCHHCDALLKGKARGALKDIEKHVQQHFPKVMFNCKECGAQIKNVPAHIAKEHESSEVELEDLRLESEMIENLSKCFPDLISPEEGGYMDQLPEELESEPVNSPFQAPPKVSLPEFLLNDNIPETSLDHLLK